MTLVRRISDSLFVRPSTRTTPLRRNHGEVFRMPISDSQVFIALFTALLAGILAIRLGIELYA